MLVHLAVVIYWVAMVLGSVTSSSVVFVVLCRRSIQLNLTTTYVAYSYRWLCDNVGTSTCSEMWRNGDWNVKHGHSWVTELKAAEKQRVMNSKQF